MHRREAHADTIRLRPIGPGDLPALFELQTDHESNDMAGTKPRTREAFFAAWERNFADPGVNSRVIELLIVAGLWYLLVVSILTPLQMLLERRFARGTLRFAR